ncbi:hypothetical protein PV326_011676 [Microctonus aethiopoides]|uniref:Fatty acyl-CoA reductase n=1 Tax=Microctonus aethiopoides TaxID=144406 RepID=A0AA39KWS8_9HYME|nr:hypothetical protein PV326_011676 [Microctonus aethiopoides]KAK0176562.1 hypothetical protein PV328_000683 [Microctonus aethiopoides]
MESNVIDFYRGKSIFITGGTGFLGSCLIEKLLRCCTDVKRIFILIRPKKGKNINERLEELTKNSVFDRIREEENTKLFNKLTAVAGSIDEDNLGLSIEDRFTLIEDVEIIFHSAATLDFDGSLKSAVDVNLLGTRRVVQLGQEIRNLKVLVHVSSAYVNSYLLEAKEQIYPPPADVNELVKLVNDLSEDVVEEMAPKLLKDHPNSYTFTKHLAEHEVINGSLPSAIVRASMITAAWKEPVPGWTTSKNGPQGFLMGASKGVVRRLPIVKHYIYDYIPVDIVVNSLIVAGYAIGSNAVKTMKVFHCTSSTCNPFKWEAVEKNVNNYLHQFPLKSAVWYPHLKFLPSLWLYRISALFIHMIPAYILDTVTRISGGRPILVRLHTNVNNSLGRLERFIFTEWKFYNPRLLELHESLSPNDKELFNLNIKSLVWEDYFVDLTKGVRVYLSKEPLKNLSKARAKDNVLLILHLGLQAMLMGLIWWIVKIILGSTWTKTGMVVPIFYFFYSQL